MGKREDDAKYRIKSHKLGHSGSRSASAHSVLMKIVGGGGGQVGSSERLDGLRLHMDHVLDVLEHAGDDEEWLLGDEQTAVLEKLGSDDGVGGAGFVFEADEDEAFGSAGSLPAGHLAADTEQRRVGRSGQVCRNRCLDRTKRGALMQ
jgi:hypothetical protein